MIARSGDQSNPSMMESPNACRASVVFPAPEGPTINPTCHGFASIGSL
jgi:hypothetical protein